jgi:hypothetical protein
MEGSTVDLHTVIYALLVLGIGCVGTLLLAYNLWMAAMQARMEYDEGASGVALGSWIGSLASLFVPGCGMFFAFITFVMAQLESNKLYTGDTPPASAIPAAVARFNSVLVILINLVLMAAACLLWFV